MTAQEVLALRVTLLRAGYSPIPLFGKVPPAYGKNNARKGLGRWQTLGDVSDEQIEMWSQTWPDADQHRRAHTADAGARPGFAQRRCRRRGRRLRARAVRGSRLRPDPDRTGAEAGHSISYARAVREDRRQPRRAERQR